MDSPRHTLQAMHRQEQVYAKTAFHYQAECEPRKTGPLHVDVECRSKMVAWCYQVIDYCRFSRETAEVAMSYLDRFAASPRGRRAREDRHVFQLAAMACLYTAVKISEPEAMNPQLVSNLSRGTYTPRQVEEMEAEVLQALDWRMNPPTALSFVRLLLGVVPADALTEPVRQTAYDLAKYQTELALGEYHLLTVRPSTVAFCALTNALESLPLDAVAAAAVGGALAGAVRLDAAQPPVREVSNRLYETVLRQSSGDLFLQPPTGAAAMAKPAPAARRMSVDVSPRAVADVGRY